MTSDNSYSNAGGAQMQVLTFERLVVVAQHQGSTQQGRTAKGVRMGILQALIAVKEHNGWVKKFHGRHSKIPAAPIPPPTHMVTMP